MAVAASQVGAAAQRDVAVRLRLLRADEGVRARDCKQNRGRGSEDFAERSNTGLSPYPVPGSLLL